MLEQRFEMNTTLSLPQLPHPVSYLAVSRQKMFYVFSYSPLMGRSGTTVTIDTLFNHTSWGEDVHIRIVIGCQPIPTVIKNIEGCDTNLWRCTGVVPELAAQKFASTHTVNVSIEAVVRRNVVLDSVAFGFFTYREYGLFPSIPLDPSLFGAFREGSPLLHVTRPPTAQSVPPHQVAQSGTSPAPLQALERILRRYESRRAARHVRVALHLEGDLRNVGKNLSDEEKVRCRRLVRFVRKEEGNKLHLFFYPIRQEEYEEGFFVISCIYREDSRDTWCTSVDLIHLIEFISQETKSNNEKGRIRRNLEFLRPTTVSRMVRPQLFQILMDFPMPKPRTIEKAVKVFRWNSLVTGLNKVMEKYSWIGTRRSPDGPPARPKSSVNKFHDAPQRPASNPPITTLTSFDGAHAPQHTGSSTQPEVVPATHVNPSWLHSQNAFIASPVGSPFVCGNMPSSSPPVPAPAHITADTEASHNNRTLTACESFHHFDSLDLQTLRIA